MAIAIDFDDTPQLSLPPAPPVHPFRLRRVLGLLRSLNEDAEATLDALEMFDAAGGDSGERIVQGFVRDPRGRRLMLEKPRIERVLADREALAAMSEGSLGRAYLAFAEENGFAADGLAQLGREVEREHERLDPHRQWFWDRYSVTHDLHHVLTGCATTEDGEVVLLAFSQAQTPQRGFRLLVALAVVNSLFDWRRLRRLRRAWRAGRRAQKLLFVRWEEQLDRPLDELRRELRVPVLSHG